MADQIDAKIGDIHGPTDPMSVYLGAELNLPNGAFDANLFRRPDFWVYIFTISKREFVVSQPPLFPRVLIPACGPDDKYRRIVSIPHPFNQVDREGAIGDFVVRGHNAERVAMSLVNPNNLTLDQDAVPPEKSVLGLGVDLNAQGIFWSRNEVPTADELKAANRRRERYYRSLMDRARTLEIANPKELEFLINEDYHMAAEYFHEERTWHRSYTQYEECPNCGEQIKPRVAYHKNSMGFICIVDAERAAAAGVTPSTISIGDKS